MADHRIRGNAGCLGKAVIPDVGRNHLELLDDVLVADVVQRFGAHACLDVRRDHRKHVSREPASDAQLNQILLGLKTDAAAHEAAFDSSVSLKD